MPMGLQHSHVWDPGPSFPTCPRLRTAPSQTLFEQLSMKVALSLAWARSTRCTRSDWNWDPFLIYDLIYWICSLNFIDFQPMIEKTNWTIGSLPKDDAFTAIFWIWIWWHIKIILQASECLYIYIYASFHTSWCSCMKNTTTASWHHNSIQDIYTCGYIIYTYMRITILQMTYAV